ncbi:MAG: hypothetical protein N5P05_002421 [Chroococcopsis gigantea SAG 12.99]|jgi:cyanoexosortase A|nr:cyanoexosortase A [Chlorogloea purpurea SAG 13.99]MDV3000815.1 hypothetical protein [Chroococcopsis gigantea SAG 12.99]
MSWVKYLQKPDYWLVALASALALLHLTLLDLSNQPNLMSVSILLWLSIASLLWDKRATLKLDSKPWPTIAGFIIITLVILRSFSDSGYQLRVSPLLTGFGLALMASGFRGLYQYWKELFILFLLILDSSIALALQWLNLQVLTAKMATLLLTIAGFNVYRDGVIIGLPTGRVEVYGACSGVESITLMINIAILFFLLIPIKNIHKIISLVVAIILGFLVNCIRVGIMLMLVAGNNQESFEYWHGKDGSLIFAMISVFVFGIFCWFAYVRELSLPDNKL